MSLIGRTSITILIPSVHNEDLDLSNIVCFKKSEVKELKNYLPHNRPTHYYFNPIATCEEYMLSFKLVMKDTSRVCVVKQSKVSWWYELTSTKNAFFDNNSSVIYILLYREHVKHSILKRLSPAARIYWL